VIEESAWKVCRALMEHDFHIENLQMKFPGNISILSMKELEEQFANTCKLSDAIQVVGSKPRLIEFTFNKKIHRIRAYWSPRSPSRNLDMAVSKRMNAKIQKRCNLMVIHRMHKTC
jgi:hypothetical protein